MRETEVRGPALPIVAFFPFIATLSGGRRVLWRASPSLRREADSGGRGRPYIAKLRPGVRTCINAPSAGHIIRLSGGYCFWILMGAGGGWQGPAVPAAIISSSCATAASSKRSAAAATPGKSDRTGRARATERGKAATFGPTPASQLPSPCLCRPRTFDLWALLARAMPRSQ